jgi:type IV pilus assembly protein PilC
MTKVVPTLASTFKDMGAQLPASTRVIVAISDFLVHHTIGAIVLVVGTVTACYFALRSERGQSAFNLLLLHTPSIGTIVREVNAARTARTIASLISSGVDLLATLEITQDVIQNSHFRAVIKDAYTAVSQGEPLSSVFLKNERLYPPFVGEMIAVGEETGQSAEMLKRLAVYYEGEVDRKTKDMSTIIEPFLMLFIGSAVGFFAVAMISPIYAMSQNIN